MREFKSLLEDAERLLGYDADDKEARGEGLGFRA